MIPFILAGNNFASIRRQLLNEKLAAFDYSIFFRGKFISLNALVIAIFDSSTYFTLVLNSFARSS